MVHPDYAARQRARWLRPDASRWLRPDAAKFLKPNSDPADVFPALAQRRDLARCDIDAALARERVVLDGLRRELDAIRSELARAHVKYSPDQARVPAGSSGGGQWTSGSGGGGRPRIIIDTTNLDNEGEADDEEFGSFAGDEDFFADDFEDDANFDETDSQSTSESDSSRDRSSGGRQPTGITDTRVVSDADPDVVRPGEQYAQNIRSVTDANGNPYYARGGHHELPEGVSNKWNLQPETQRVFNSATTGTVVPGFGGAAAPRGHLWDGPKGAHGQYNEAVTELSEDFMIRNSIRPEQMTPKHAEDLLAEIRSSEDSRIRDFNRAIRLLRRAFRFGRSE